MWGRWDWVELDDLVALTLGGFRLGEFLHIVNIGTVLRVPTTGEGLVVEWMHDVTAYCSRMA
jgi:hypothetical protein